MLEKAYSRKRQYCLERGFTLLELLVVCTLIMILLTAVVPAFRDALFSNPFHLAANRVAGVVEYGRQNALTSRYGCYLAIDISENRLWCSCPEYVSVSIDEPEDDKSVSLPAPISFSSVESERLKSIDSGVALLWINRRGMMEETVINIGNEKQTMAVIFSVFTSDFTLMPKEMSITDIVQE